MLTFQRLLEGIKTTRPCSENKEQWNALHKVYNRSTISLIGNGPSALRAYAGEIVDNSDLVVRMNQYCLHQQFDQHIGRKTDIFASNLFIPDLNKTESMLMDDGVSMVWSSFPSTNFIPNQDESFVLFKERFSRLPMYRPSLPDFVGLMPDNIFYLVTKLALFRLFGTKIFRKLRLSWTIPTTGLVAVALALKLNPKYILLVGYDFFQGEASHYFDNSRKTPSLTHHQFGVEPVVLSVLAAQHPTTRFELRGLNESTRVRALLQSSNITIT